MKLGQRYIDDRDADPGQFDGENLETVGVVMGTWFLTTADLYWTARRWMLNDAAKVGPSNATALPGPATRACSTMASLSVKEPAYLHFFGLTERSDGARRVLWSWNRSASAVGTTWTSSTMLEAELGTCSTLIDETPARLMGCSR